VRAREEFLRLHLEQSGARALEFEGQLVAGIEPVDGASAEMISFTERS